MDADAEPAVDVELFKQPSHADEHEMKIVGSRTLNDPVDTTRDKLM